MKKYSYETFVCFKTQIILFLTPYQAECHFETCKGNLVAKINQESITEWSNAKDYI